MLLPLVALGCDSGDTDKSGDTDTTDAPLAIIGSYTVPNTDSVDRVVITADTLTSEWSTGTKVITHTTQYNNDEGWVVGQGDDANDAGQRSDRWFPSYWTEVGGKLYFCSQDSYRSEQAALDEMTNEPPDASDPATNGCPPSSAADYPWFLLEAE